MSSSTRFSRKSIIGSIAIAGAAGFVAIGLVVPSGAAFSDTESARVDINTASLVLNVSDADTATAIDLDFNNLKPGETQQQSFTVLNAGTISGDVVVGSNFTNGTQPVQGVDYNQLKVGISGYSGLTPVTQLPSEWNLGSVAPGQSRTFTFDVSLDLAAGNEWQDADFGGNIPVTLKQN